jgi:hypothetical protein
MEVSEVRRRLRGAIERAKQRAAERRAVVDAANRDYETFLTSVAIPTVMQVAQALVGEGHPFKVETPAGSVRMAAERSSDFIEITLDTAQDPPQVVGQTSMGRGRSTVTSERPLREGTAIGTLNDEDVLEFLAEEVVKLIAK